MIARILSSRRMECRRFVKLQSLTGLSDGLSRNSSVLIGMPIVLVPLLTGQPLIASSIFIALSLADTLARSILCMSNGLKGATDCYSVIKRTEDVLLLEEKDITLENEDIISPMRIVASDLTTTWLKRKELTPLKVMSDTDYSD